MSFFQWVIWTIINCVGLFFTVYMSNLSVILNAMCIDFPADTFSLWSEDTTSLRSLMKGLNTIPTLQRLLTCKNFYHCLNPGFPVGLLIGRIFSTGNSCFVQYCWRFYFISFYFILTKVSDSVSVPEVRSIGSVLVP